MITTSGRSALSVVRFSLIILASALLLASCADGNWLGESTPPAKTAEGPRPYTLESVAERAFDSVISNSQPRSDAVFGRFVMTGRVGDKQRFALTDGRAIDIVIDSVKFKTAARSTCRRVTVHGGIERGFETRACSLDGAYWYLLRRLHEVRGTY